MSKFSEALSRLNRGLKAHGFKSSDAYADTGLVVEQDEIDPFEPPFDPNDDPGTEGTFIITDLEPLPENTVASFTVRNEIKDPVDYPQNRSPEDHSEECVWGMDLFVEVDGVPLTDEMSDEEVAKAKIVLRPATKKPEEKKTPQLLKIPTTLDTRYAYKGNVKTMPELGRIYEAVRQASQTKHQTVQILSQVTLDNGRKVKAGVFTKSQLAYLDTDAIRYVEQNPTKDNPFAEAARQGNLVVWVIKRTDDSWLGYILNGHVFMRKS